jgi:predicted HTH domain antitoxin
MKAPTVTIETEVPKDVYQTLQAHGVFREHLSRQVRELLAIRFYKERALSLGQAARLAGQSRWAFIELLSTNDVPVIDYTDEELDAEFEAASRLDAEAPA